MFAILLLGSAWFRAERRRNEGTPLEPRPAATAPAQVDLWVGELGDGVKGVLSSEWGEPLADARYDAEMNRDLGLPPAAGLAYYRLTVFNTGERPVTLAFEDGALVITPRGGDPLPMKSLATLLGGANGPVPQTLRWLGADRVEVAVPAGRRHSHPVAFGRRVALSEAVSVARADGTAFRPRRIPGAAWSGLLENPSVDGLKDL